MADTPTVQQTLQDLTTSPKSVQTDGGSTTAVSVQEVIAADKYLAAKEASAGVAKSKGLGIRIGILRGPGHF